MKKTKRQHPNWNVDENDCSEDLKMLFINEKLMEKLDMFLKASHRVMERLPRTSHVYATTAVYVYTPPFMIQLLIKMYPDQVHFTEEYGRLLLTLAKTSRVNNKLSLQQTQK